MKRIFWVIVALLVLSVQAAAVPVFEINHLDAPFYFSGAKKVLIFKGDAPEYSAPDFDDSRWDLTRLPSSWKELYPGYNGVVWYRLHFHFPPNHPPRSIGVMLGIITDADEIFFNGVKIGGSGSLFPQKSAYDKTRIYEIPSELIRHNETNVLAIRVKGLFDYQNGPYTGTMKIDRMDKMTQDFFKKEILDISFVIMYLVVGIYFLLFFIRRVKDKENLAFALFTIGISAYFLFRTQLKYTLGWDFFVAKKLEYLVLCWLVYLMNEFIMLYFKAKRRIIHWVYLGITSVSFCVLLLSNDYVFWDNFNQYGMIPSWLIGISSTLAILVSRFRRERDARLMLYAMIVLMGTLVNDILLNMAIYRFIRLSGYGFAVFVASLAVILSNRFVRLHEIVHDLNLNLEKKVEERTTELNHAVENLKAAQAETDNLLENVEEGIFLIDRDFRISGKYSKRLENIFETGSLGNRNFPEFVGPMIDQKTLEATNDFLEIAFTRDFPTKRLLKLNPLAAADFQFPGDGKVIHKTLDFSFSRVKDHSGKVFLLATVLDITEKALLALKIEESEKRTQEEMKLLFGIIHINPVILKRFLNESADELNRIEVTLKEASFSKDLVAILQSVFRSAHSIKSNAGMLGLKVFMTRAEEFEDKIKELDKKKDLAPLDLMGLLFSLVSLKEVQKNVNHLLEQILEFQSSFGKGEIGESEMLRQSLSALVERVRARENKDCQILLENFQVPETSDFPMIELKNALIQIVKNSITHGIEAPQERIAAGKSPQGRIEVSSKIEDGTYTVAVEDDGRGIPIAELKEHLIQNGRYTREQLETMGDREIAQHIFDPGITTRSQNTIDAGRGVGLDLVNHEVHQWGGSIRLSFQKGRFTRFELLVPMKKEASHE